MKRNEGMIDEEDCVTGMRDEEDCVTG